MNKPTHRVVCEYVGCPWPASSGSVFCHKHRMIPASPSVTVLDQFERLLTVTEKIAAKLDALDLRVSSIESELTERRNMFED